MLARMDEIEVPTEKLHETIHEQAHHHAPEGDGLSMRVALSSAVIAALAALAALIAGHHANEAVIEQLQASDQWALYQAKGIKASLLASTGELLRAGGHEQPAEESAHVDDYRREQREIEQGAREKENGSRVHLRRHEVLARSVTLFQVGIAMAAIAVLTRRKGLWLASLALGAVGMIFFVQGLL
jgi:hypothetical protein